MENELSKGFTGIEINGVRFSNIGEMLRYMDRQREQLEKAKELLKRCHDNYVYLEPLRSEIEQFLKSSEVNNALS